MRPSPRKITAFPVLRKEAAWGLTITKGILNKLGGDIRIDSEKGTGTHVIFRLPFNGKELAPVSEVTQKNAGELADNTVILVAEDEESNYFYIEVALSKSGYRVLHVEDGKSAVEMCQKHPEIDLVLMDIKMPVMDGLEATLRIKEFRKDLPVITITAYALSGDEHRILEAGCDDYLAKPVKKDVLNRMIDKYLKT